LAFSLTELAILAGLAEGKTLSAIAQQLCLGQPGVSKALRFAEQRTNLPLVERGGYRIKLTATGAEVALKARQVIDRLQELDRFIRELQAGRAGPVRLISTSAPGYAVLPDVVGAFLGSFPAADVQLQVERHNEIWQVCLRDSFDVGLGPLTSDVQLLEARGWLVERLYEDHVTFFVAPGHRLAGRRVGLEEIRQDRIVGPFAEPHWSDTWEQLNGQGFPTTRRMTLLGGDAVKRVVAGGGGLGMLFGLSVLNEVQEGRLVPLLLDILPPSTWYGLVVRADVQRVPIVETFRDFLNARLATVCPQLAAIGCNNGSV
jgi:DNA-binding transcriptional LysR family regulator